MWNLRYGTKEPVYETETDAQTEGTDLGLPRDGEFGFSGCKLSYAEWRDNKGLPCSTGSSIQYPEITRNGKNMKRKVYMRRNHSAEERKLTRPCTSITLWPFPKGDEVSPRLK